MVIWISLWVIKNVNLYCLCGFKDSLETVTLQMLQIGTTVWGHLLVWNSVNNIPETQKDQSKSGIMEAGRNLD